MKIRYISDIHLECIKPHKIDRLLKTIAPNTDEICILAGDIGNPFSTNYDTFMKFIEKSFKKTFIITGNHEYYNKTKSMDEINDHLTEYIKQFNHITFLNNNYEIYNDHCFAGTTLWSKITKPEYEINDVYNIPGLNYMKYNRLHEQAKRFLENLYEINYPQIIITHHVPMYELIDAKYKIPKMEPYNQWFCCDMSEFIEKNKHIKCWLYGHTHTPAYNVINGTPFVCNPIGYPNENAKRDFNKTIQFI